MPSPSWKAFFTLRRAILIGAAFVAGVSTAAVFYNTGPAPQPAATGSKTAHEAVPGDKRTFALRPHDQPRPLKPFKFIDGDLKAASLSDFRGKIVLLNIWATWCVPCRAEMPTLERLQQSLGGPEFEVVALSIDQEGVPVVKKFYQELGITRLRIFVDPTMRAPQELGAIGVPTTLLVDREGREIARYAGPAEWDSPEVVATIRSHIEGPLAARPGGSRQTGK